MTPKRYLATMADNRSLENLEYQQDEITALRKALREARSEIERLKAEKEFQKYCEDDPE